MENILELKNVTKRYKRFRLDNVSFSVSGGSICGFVGINGAGKSTTVKIIEDLVKKDEGTVMLFGKSKLSSDIKELIGFVPDSCYFYEKKRVIDIKRSIRSFYNTWNEENYHKYIEFFGLDEKKRVEELSKGMKMQLSLTLALSHNARLLIMDEPTSGLDPYIRSQVMTILKEYVADGEKAVLFSTHIMSDLERIADKVVFIHNGSIVLEECIKKLPEVFVNRFGIEWTSLDESLVKYIEKIKEETK